MYTELSSVDDVMFHVTWWRYAIVRSCFVRKQERQQRRWRWTKWENEPRSGYIGHGQTQTNATAAYTASARHIALDARKKICKKESSSRLSNALCTLCGAISTMCDSYTFPRNSNSHRKHRVEHVRIIKCTLHNIKTKKRKRKPFSACSSSFRIPSVFVHPNIDFFVFVECSQWVAAADTMIIIHKSQRELCITIQKKRTSIHLIFDYLSVNHLAVGSLQYVHNTIVVVAFCSFSAHRVGDNARTNMNRITFMRNTEKLRAAKNGAERIRERTCTHTHSQCREEIN